MRKNFETFKHNLEEEHNKLSDDLRKIENRHRIINRNKLERRLECILEFSIIPFILSFGLVYSNIIPWLIPVIMFSSSFMVGTCVNFIIEKKGNIKNKLGKIIRSRKNKDIKEEEVNHIIDYEITKNKMRVVEKIISNINKKEELLNIKKENTTKLTEEEMEKNINELKINLLKAFDELDVFTKRKVLSERFWNSRDNLQVLTSMIVIPMLVSAFLMFAINFPVYQAGGAVNLLSLLLPFPITQAVASVYVIKNTKTDREIFKKLNKGLNGAALTKKPNHEVESKQKMQKLITEKIDNVCVIYNELLEQQELLDDKKHDREEKELASMMKILEQNVDVKDPIMSIYGIYNNYFDSKQELDDFCSKTNFPQKDTYRLDFIGNFAGRKDVVRTVASNGKMSYYAMIDEDGYAMYNHERSCYIGEFVWEYNYGDIRKLYNLFKQKGISLTNDVYGKIDDYHNRIYELVMNMSNETEINKQKTLKKENN